MGFSIEIIMMWHAKDTPHSTKKFGQNLPVSNWGLFNALKGITANFYPGEFVGILGKTGLEKNFNQRDYSH